MVTTYVATLALLAVHIACTGALPPSTYKLSTLYNHVHKPEYTSNTEVGAEVDAEVEVDLDFGVDDSLNVGLGLRRSAAHDSHTSPLGVVESSFHLDFTPGTTVGPGQDSLSQSFSDVGGDLFYSCDVPAFNTSFTPYFSGKSHRINSDGYPSRALLLEDESVNNFAWPAASVLRPVGFGGTQVGLIRGTRERANMNTRKVLPLDELARLYVEEEGFTTRYEHISSIVQRRMLTDCSCFITFLLSHYSTKNYIGAFYPHLLEEVSSYLNYLYKQLKSVAWLEYVVSRIPNYAAKKLAQFEGLSLLEPIWSSTPEDGVYPEGTPRARDYFDFFKSLKPEKKFSFEDMNNIDENEPMTNMEMASFCNVLDSNEEDKRTSKYWKHVAIMDLRPGDLIAYNIESYTPGGPQNTGHIMIVTDTTGIEELREWHKIRCSKHRDQDNSFIPWVHDEEFGEEPEDDGFNTILDTNVLAFAVMDWIQFLTSKMRRMALGPRGEVVFGATEEDYEELIRTAGVATWGEDDMEGDSIFTTSESTQEEEFSTLDAQEEDFEIESGMTSAAVFVAKYVARFVLGQLERRDELVSWVSSWLSRRPQQVIRIGVIDASSVRHMQDSRGPGGGAGEGRIDLLVDMHKRKAVATRFRSNLAWRPHDIVIARPLVEHTSYLFSD